CKGPQRRRQRHPHVLRALAWRYQSINLVRLSPSAPLETTVVPTDWLPDFVALLNIRGSVDTIGAGFAQTSALTSVRCGGTAMLKEYHYDHLIRWPKGERACVFLTFDFQG